MLCWLERPDLLYQSMMDCFASVDMTGRIDTFNEPFLALVGYSPEELRALTFQDLTPEKWHAYEGGILETQVMTRGHSDVYQKEYRTKQGAVVPVELRTFLIRNELGTPEGMWAIVRDITERKRTEARLAVKRQLLYRLLHVQERDRKLIAHEIHDGFLQCVIGAEMLLQSVQRRSESQGAVPLEDLDSARKLLARGIAEARRLIGGLRPVAIDEEGALKAIEVLLADDLNDGTLKIDFQCQVAFRLLDPVLETTIFRIVQEALNNVKRHSQSKTAIVRLTQIGQTLSIEVRDEGIGFVPNEVSPDRFGVRGICERARIFGGRAIIDSRPGKGTRIRVELPLALTPPDAGTEAGLPK